MATYTSILAWRIPWTEEPGRLQVHGIARVGHNLVTKQQQQLVYLRQNNWGGDRAPHTSRPAALRPLSPEPPLDTALPTRGPGSSAETVDLTVLGPGSVHQWADISPRLSGAPVHSPVSLLQPGDQPHPPQDNHSPPPGRSVPLPGPAGPKPHPPGDKPNFKTPLTPDVQGGPGAKTPHSQYRGPGFNPWSEK